MNSEKNKLALLLVILLTGFQFCYGHPAISEPLTTISSSKATDLEMELKSLQDVSEKPNFFDELVNDEHPQQNKRSDEENSIEEITTLTPMSMTEEETRVDEPTDKGPTEPTNILEVTKPTVHDESTHLHESIHSATRLPITESDSKLLHTISSLAEDVSGELVKNSEEDDNSISEELHMVKNGIVMLRDEVPTDDLISATLVTTAYPEETTKKSANDKSKEESHSVEDDESEESNENSDGGVSLAPEHLLPVEVTQSSKIDTTEAVEMFTRNARKLPVHSSSLAPSSHGNEDLLELMVKVAEEPGGWQKVAQILGKLDYKTSSQLKSALQVKALKEKNYKAMHKHLEYPYHPGNEKLGTHNNPREFYHDFKPKTENDVNKQALIIQSNMPGHEEHSAQHSRMKLENQDTTEHPIRGNYHSHWQPRPRPPSPIHMLRMNYLNTPSVSPALAGAIAKNKGVKTGPLNHPSGSVDHHYDGPINAIAIDVPGTGKKPIANMHTEKPNKQAYIAVTVYKPTKNKFHKVDLKPKINQNKPLRLQQNDVPLQKQSKNFAVEKPVTIISQKNQKHPKPKNGIKNEVGADGHFETDHKLMKSKLKNKNKAQATRPKPLKHPAKWKPKSQMATDQMEAQLMALTMMETKLKEQLMQKERLRQRLRMKHHNQQHRVSRDTAFYV